MSTGAHTWHEIISQPQTWQATLEGFAADRSALRAFLDRTGWDEAAVVGCGSTHYLAQSAATTFTRRTGRPALAFPSSELWLFPRCLPPGRWLLLAVSRSGRTSETLIALRRFRQLTGGPVLAVTCHPESALVTEADLSLVAPHAQERSVAQTRSFSNMLLLTLALTATAAQDGPMLDRLARLPGLLDDLVSRVGDLPRDLGADLTIERLFFLGAGPFYGLANEAMLKTKEMSLSHAEAYHPLEFRHGPMSMVNDRTLVVGLLSDAGLEEELKVLREMQRLGAQTLAFVDNARSISGWQPTHLAELRSGLVECERGPLLLPIVQRLAYHRSMAKGLDPDRPHNLTAVVELQAEATA